MRRHAIRILKILHGAMLLACLYNIVMQQLTERHGLLLLRNLYFLLLSAVLFEAAERAKKVWQFVLPAVLLLGDAWLAGGGGWGSIWMCVCAGLASFSYFAARAKKTDCWLAQPGYPWLLLYLALYFVGMHFESRFLMSFASVGAGCYFILCSFYVNLTEVENFVKTHSTLERLPVKRLGRINQGMMWMFSGITVAAMVLSPFLGLDQLVWALGRALRAVLAWILGFLPQGSSQEEIVQEEMGQQQMALPSDPEEVSPLLELLYRLIDILAFVLLICLILGLLYMGLRKLYRFYRQFYQETEENGDRIERLMAAAPGEVRKNTDRRPGERLFWNFSWEARVRKHYKRQIQKAYREQIPDTATPSQLEEQLEMSGEEKAILHRCYEKARYGKEGLTREEMQEALKMKQ